MRRRRPFAVLACVALTAAPKLAQAQVRWDMQGAEGVEHRALASKPAGLGDAGFGSTFDASAHVALLPLLRIGAYAHYDTSSASGAGARGIASGGLDLRLGAPWPRGPMRTYLRLGIGEAATFAGPHRSLTSFVCSSAGEFTEVPLAVGLQYRAAPRLSVSAELGARLGLAFHGTAYGTGTSGDDVLAVGFELGAVWGR